jgi:hypothetical protein
MNKTNMQPPICSESGPQPTDPAGILELVRSANDSFRSFFQRYAGMPVRGTDEEVEAMLEVESTLRAVGRLLRGDLKVSRDGEMGEELACYRDNLLRLRQELCSMQRSARQTRARLFTREEHLHAAQAWCETNRSTR